MSMRNMKLADHRGRDATVFLLPRMRTVKPAYRDRDGNPVRFARLIKATDETRWEVLRSRLHTCDEPARVLIDSDPEIDTEVAGCETGPCDRVFVDGDGQPLYSADMIEVIHDVTGCEVERREPVDAPANLEPEIPPVWSGRLIPLADAARRYAFTRAYRIMHADALRFDFLHGLASHLEGRDRMALVGSGPKGTGPLILERNGVPMKGLLEGRTAGERYLLILHLAAFELRSGEAAL